MPANTSLIGYVVAQAVAENVFMGAILITDCYGMPAEFRYTEPVRATKIQKILYGDVLEKYILCDVIAANLTEKLEQKPEIMVVSDYRLLTAFEGKSARAVELLQTRVPPLKEYGATQDVSPGEFLVQLSETGSPVRGRFLSVGGAPDTAKQSESVRSLSAAGKTMEILEPLVRVQGALQMLWEDVPEFPV